MRGGVPSRTNMISLWQGPQLVPILSAAPIASTLVAAPVSTSAL